MLINLPSISKHRMTLFGRLIEAEEQSAYEGEFSFLFYFVVVRYYLQAHIYLETTAMIF